MTARDLAIPLTVVKINMMTSTSMLTPPTWFGAETRPLSAIMEWKAQHWTVPQLSLMIPVTPKIQRFIGAQWSRLFRPSGSPSFQRFDLFFVVARSIHWIPSQLKSLCTLSCPLLSSLSHPRHGRSSRPQRKPLISSPIGLQWHLISPLILLRIFRISLRSEHRFAMKQVFCFPRDLAWTHRRTKLPTQPENILCDIVKCEAAKIHLLPAISILADRPYGILGPYCWFLLGWICTGGGTVQCVFLTPPGVVPR
mmetsp:Transcript_30391/g.80774  ORF Transcript_30391/g.80774 Transcript_30391/m.80774 type:complete len:253 (-) Transcript_30391:806-1564(-)